MAGTITGGLQAAKSNKERHGTDYYVELDRKGGLKKVPKGFAISGKASEAGRIGGLRSRRGFKLINGEYIEQ